MYGFSPFKISPTQGIKKISGKNKFFPFHICFFFSEGAHSKFYWFRLINFLSFSFFIFWVGEGERKEGFDFFRFVEKKKD